MTEQEAIKSLKEMFPKGLCEKDEYEMSQKAINALEEVEPYRAIGTPEECLQNKDFLRFLANSMNQKKYETYLRIYNAVEKEGREELKPCPFCGCHDRRVGVRKMGTKGYRIICGKCGCAGPYVKIKEFPNKMDAQGKAKETWNRRVNDGKND